MNFVSRTRKEQETQGYHVTEPMKIKDLDKFLSICNEKNYTFIQALYTGVVVQVIYKI